MPITSSMSDTTQTGSVKFEYVYLSRGPRAPSTLPLNDRHVGRIGSFNASVLPPFKKDFLKTEETTVLQELRASRIIAGLTAHRCT